MSTYLPVVHGLIEGDELPTREVEEKENRKREPSKRVYLRS